MAIPCGTRTASSKRALRGPTIWVFAVCRVDFDRRDSEMDCTSSLLSGGDGGISWETECAKMHDIYRSSVLTIAAISSTDGG
jgi:hypothetical protein